MNNWADEVDERGFVVATVVAAAILLLGFFTPSPFGEFVAGAIIVWLVIAIGSSPILIAVALDSTLGRGMRHCLVELNTFNALPKSEVTGSKLFGAMFHALLLICLFIIFAVIIFYIVLIALLGIFFGGLAVLSMVGHLIKSVLTVDV